MELNSDQFQLVLNKQSFKISPQFPHYFDISQKIISSFLNNADHQYHVKTNVNEEIFKSFVKYLTDDEIPNVDEENFYLYCRLCEEFQNKPDSLQLISKIQPKLDEYLININYLKYYTNDLLFKTEETISQQLDEYLTKQGEKLMESPIQSLFNIFNKAQFDNHDLVYNLIKEQFEKSQDSRIFILLDFLDGKKLSERNLSESIELKDIRCKFMPRIDFSYISGQFESISLINKIHQKELEKNKKRIEKINNEINEIAIKQSKEIQNIYKKYLIYLFIAFILIFYLLIEQRFEINKIKQTNQKLSKLISSISSSQVNLTKNNQKLEKLISNISSSQVNMTKNNQELEKLISNISSSQVNMTKNNQELEKLISNISSSQVNLTKNKQEFIHHPKNNTIKSFIAEIDNKSPGILSILKTKEKSKFNPLFIASLSSDDIYNLIQDNDQIFATPYLSFPNTFSFINFEIFEKVTINGIQIFSSKSYFPKSFNVEIEGNTVISIDEAHELNGTYKNMTINFDPIRTNNITFIQRGGSWDNDCYSPIIQHIELLSTDEKYFNGVFSTLINQNKNDPHNCGVFISSSDFDFNSFYDINTETYIYSQPQKNPYFQIEFLEGFAAINGFRLGKHSSSKLKEFKIIATDDKNKPLDEWITLIEIKEETEFDHRFLDTYKFNQTSPQIKIIRLVQTGPSWTNNNYLKFRYFDVFGIYFQQY